MSEELPFHPPFQVAKVDELLTQYLSGPIKGLEWGSERASELPCELKEYERTYFYNTYSETGFLTNLHLVSIAIDGHVFKSAEHYYQWAAFRNRPDIQKQIMRANKGREAFDIARKYRKNKDADWMRRNLETMGEVVLQKFLQNSDLAVKLMKTGKSILVEDALGYDNFYGNGADGRGGKFGGNHLGLILMRVREFLFDLYGEDPSGWDWLL